MTRYRSARLAAEDGTEWGAYYWINRDLTAAVLHCDPDGDWRDAYGEPFWQAAAARPSAWRRACIRTYQRRVSARGCTAASCGPYESRYAPPVIAAGVKHHHGVQPARGARPRRKRAW